ncbi:MAG: hypothetical protein ACK42G_10005 [Candidatus Kapaibacteriota bacterium]
MKTIHLLLVFVLLFGFVGMDEASGQPGCEECYAPWRCTTFSLQINCNGVGRTIEYTVCYYCYLTLPRVDAEITSIRGIPVGSDCWRIAQDAGKNWILDNGMELCGTLPCQEGIKTFEIYSPICADLVYHSDGTYDFFSNLNCEKKCHETYEWCWCNCIPGECFYPGTCTEPGIGKVHWQRIAEPIEEGNGQCTFQSVEPGNTISCQKFKSPCNENDGFPP